MLVPAATEDLTAVLDMYQREGSRSGIAEGDVVLSSGLGVAQHLVKQRSNTGQIMQASPNTCREPLPPYV